MKKTPCLRIPGVAALVGTLFCATAVSTEESATIGANTVEQWSRPYRNWHYYPDHVIPAKPKIKGFENIRMTDVPRSFNCRATKDGI